jgi:carbon monoxide dehydrogenase subunit G
MKLEQTFTVDAPVQQVWEALIDVPRITPCLPGAELTEAGEDGTYRGSFVVKLGPTTAAYAGALKMESLDEANRVATMSGKGTDKRGGGGTTASIVSTVREEPGGGTRVDVVTDFSITGRLARFGRGGMVQDVANRLLREFAACLQEELAASPPAGAAPAAPAPAPGMAAPGGAVAPGGAAAPGVAAAPAGVDATPAAAAVPPPAAAEAAATGATGAPTGAASAPAGATSAPAGAPAPPAGAARTARPGPAARRPAKPVSGMRLMLGALLDGLRRRLRARRRPRKSG